jgi:hypothetical protein
MGRKGKERSSVNAQVTRSEHESKALSGGSESYR